MKNNGLISACASSGCSKSLGQKRCCDFQQGNYIVMYPGEFEEAEANGKSTAHLKVIDYDYRGGKKVVCQAKATVSCDNGFKPLDCQSYPFFPASPVLGDVDMFIKGKKCPLQMEHLSGHADFVRATWNEVIAKSPEVEDWLNKIELVDYSEPVFPEDAEPTHALRFDAKIA